MSGGRASTTRSGDPLKIANLVAECGCSERALFGAFRKYHGHTPMEFLAECGLKSARQALLSPEPGDTVISIPFSTPETRMSWPSHDFRWAERLLDRILVCSPSISGEGLP
jgi:hypothetical protein